MPKIPLLTPQVSPSSGGGPRLTSQRPQAVPSHNRHNVAAAAFKGVGEILGVVYKRMQQVEATNVQSQLADFESKKRIELKAAYQTAAIPDGEEGALEDPDHPFKWADSFREKMDQDFEKMSDGIHTPYARDIFERRKAKLNASFQLKLAQMGENIAATKAKLKFQKAIDGHVMSAMNDPQDFEDIKATFEEDLDIYAENGLLNGIDKELAKRQFLPKIAISALGSRVRDPKTRDQVKKELKANQWDEYINADDKVRMLDLIKRHEDSEQADSSKLDGYRRFDFHKFLTETGQAPPPADVRVLTQGKKGAEFLIDRIDFMDAKQKKYDTADTRYFSKNEIKEFSMRLNDMPAKEQAIRFHTLAKNLAKHPKALFEFGEAMQEEFPSLGMALGMADERPDLVQKQLHGRKLIQEKGLDDVGLKASQKIYDTLLPPHVLTQTESGAKLRATSRAGFFEYLTARAADESKPISALGTEDIEKYFHEYMGPIPEINGRKTLSFLNEKGEWVSPGRIEDIIDHMTPEQIKATHGELPMVNKSDFENIQYARKRIELVPAGDGLYMVIKDGEFPWKKKDGDVFLLDVRELDRTMDKFLGPKGGVGYWGVPKQGASY